jgi:putative redox protein
MEVKVQHLGNVKFAASARGHRVICDQPQDNGGTDAGMTPPEFLLVSLGTCVGFYAAKYLETRKLSVDGLAVRVVADKALQPARLAQFRIELIVPGLDPAHEAGILRAAKACLIHNTLVNAPAIETVLRTGPDTSPDTSNDTIGIRAELAETTRN